MAGKLFVTRTNTSVTQGYVATPTFTTFTSKTLTSRRWVRVAHNNNGTWVIGSDDGVVAVSTNDGSTFTEYSPTNLGNPLRAEGISYIGGKFVTSSGMLMASSTNGSTWSYHTPTPSYTNPPYRLVKTRYGYVGYGPGEYVNPAGTPYYGLALYATTDYTSQWDYVLPVSYLHNDTLVPITIGDEPYSYHMSRIDTDGDLFAYLDTPGMNSASVRVHNASDLFAGSASYTTATINYHGTHSVTTQAFNSNRANWLTILWTGSFWMLGGYAQFNPSIGNAKYHPAWAYSADGLTWEAYFEESLDNYALIEGAYDGDCVYFSGAGLYDDVGPSVVVQPRLFQYDPTPPSAGTWSSIDQPSSTTNTFYAASVSPSYRDSVVLQSVESI